MRAKRYMIDHENEVMEMPTYEVRNADGDYEAALFDRREAEKLMQAVGGYIITHEEDQVVYEFPRHEDTDYWD